MKYNVIAYKPDSIDSVRGCVMAGYSSDFRFEQNLSKEGAIQVVADLLSRKLGFNEEGYEIEITTAISDGQTVSDKINTAESAPRSLLEFEIDEALEALRAITEGAQKLIADKEAEMKQAAETARKESLNARNLFK